MLERVSQFAEQAATGVSRRQFLGRLSRGALMTAGAVGAFLVLPRDAQAARPQCPEGYHPCIDRRWGRTCCPKGNKHR